MTASIDIKWNNPTLSENANVHVLANSETGCNPATPPQDDFAVNLYRRPGTPTVPDPADLLYNTSLTLPTVASNGNNIHWYTSMISTTPLVSSTVGPLNGAAAFQYYAAEYTSHCETLPAEREPVTIDLFLNPPPQPVVSGCPDVTAAFGDAPPLVSYYIESSADGTDFSKEIFDNYIFQNVTGTTTYYARANADGVPLLWSKPLESPHFPVSAITPTIYNLTGTDFCNGRLWWICNVEWLAVQYFLPIV